VFENRAKRFQRLAHEHSLGDWLHFLARLSAAQQEALRRFPTVPLPDAATLARAREHSMPPLETQSLPRHPAWRQALVEIASALEPGAPPAARRVLGDLRELPEASLEALADAVLRLEPSGAQAAAQPLVAAALQVYWTSLAASFGAEDVSALDVVGVCPCCGFLPVASVIRPRGLRYLHCALCNTEWNLERVKCAACGGTAGISYRQIEGAGGIVRAEACDSCKSYLKIVRGDADSAADPVADDLATLALDMLMDEAGFRRAGPNPLLALGSG
jgi:FdhE protein